MSQSTLYISEDESQLISYDLDGMIALFHRKSGITHILAEPAPTILDILSGIPHSAEQLTQKLTSEYDLITGDASEDELAAIILARLDELVSLGLVTANTDKAHPSYAA